MKYDIRKKSKKFRLVFSQAIFLNTSNFSTIKNEFLFRKGFINDVWQSWNYFWRAYWLAHIRGGLDGKGNRISGLYSYLNEEEAVSFLTTGNLGGSTRPYHEKTWGDINFIAKVAANIIRHGTTIAGTNPIVTQHIIFHNAVTVSSAISLLGNSVKDFQITRNTSVHLSSHSIKEFQSIITRYRIVKYKYPTDLVSTISLTDNKVALVSWHDEMTTFINLVI